MSTDKVTPIDMDMLSIDVIQNSAPTFSDKFKITYKTYSAAIPL